MPQIPYIKMAQLLKVVALRNRRANQPRASNSRTSSQVYIDKHIKIDMSSIYYIITIFFVVLALSLHSLFEGLAIGLEESIDDVWTFFIGRTIACYKLTRD